MVAAPVLVAVVSWNTRQLLADALASLRPDVDAGRASVWVLDNASTDRSAEMVASDHPWAKLIASEENLGYGPAINRIAREAPRGWRWIAPANADIVMEPGSLERLMRAGDDDVGAGAVAPRLVLPDGTTQHSVFPFPTVPFTLAFNLGLQGLSARLADRMCLEGRWDSRRERRVPWAIAAFELVRAEAWDAIGGFDDSQFMYAEDLDIGWRLREAGWGTRYVPDAPVRHESAASTSQAWGPARIDRWQTATYAWMLRRRGPARTRVVAAINVAGAGTRWAWWALVARLRRGSRHAGRRDELRRWARRHAVGLRARGDLERGV